MGDVEQSAQSEGQTADRASQAGAPATSPEAPFAPVAREVVAGRLTPRAALYLQRAAGNRSVAKLAGVRADAGAFRDRLAPGEPLESGTRGRFERAFGEDFSAVTVHDADADHRAVQELGAHAVTVGDDIAFGPGKYAPGTVLGDALIAHELAHTAQQGAVLGRLSNDEAAAERDADAATLDVVAGRRARRRLRTGLALRRCTTPEPVQTQISQQAQAATSTATPPATPATATPIDPAHPGWLDVIPWADDKTKVYSVYGVTTGAPTVAYSDRTTNELKAKQALEGKATLTAQTTPPTPPPATSGQQAPDAAQVAAKQVAIDTACNAIDAARARLPGWAFPDRLPMTDQYGGKFVGPAGYVAGTDVAGPKPIPAQKKGDKPTPVQPTAQQQAAMDSAKDYRSFLATIGHESADLTRPTAPELPTPEQAAAYQQADAKWFAKLESRLFYEASAKEGGTDSINVWDPQIVTWGGGIGSASGQASTTMFALASNKTVVDGRAVGDEVTKVLHAAGIAFASTSDPARKDWAVVDTSTKRIFRDDDAAYLLKADPRLLMLLAHISRGELPGLAPAASVIPDSAPGPANVSPALQDAIRRAAYAVQEDYFLHRYGGQAFESQIRTLVSKGWPMQAIHVVLHLQWWGSAYGPLSKFDHWDKFPGYATFTRDVITNHPDLKGMAKSFGKATLITGGFASHMVEYLLDKKDEVWEEPTDPVNADDTADGEIYAEVGVGWPPKPKHRKLRSAAAGGSGSISTAAPAASSAASSAAPAANSAAPILARRADDGGGELGHQPEAARMSRALARAVVARSGHTSPGEPLAPTTLRRLARAPTSTGTAPSWQGRIDTAWNAALRRTPHKNPADPYGNVLADLPRATSVTVVGSEHGWLKVEVDLGGRKLTGFVSHELVKPVIEVSNQVISAMSIAEAFVVLKRHETEKANTFGWKASGDVQDEIDSAIGLLEATKRYTVDRATLRVSFAAPASGKVKVKSIEDFILFVETVERTYPRATPKEVASEIRQVWFSDENWDVLLDSEGIGSGTVDIETEPDPIARQFDMKDLDPRGSTKKIQTPLGEVDIAHVMSGIDAALSATPKAMADIGDRQFKWKTLRDADKSDPRDFATWSGDIGQAYAEYLVERYVNSNSSAALDTFMASKSPPDQLLGDIHGYIALEVWRQVPRANDPAGGTLQISNVLRTLYLVDKTAAGAASYESYFEKVTGKSAAQMRDFVLERSTAFARVWYPPKMRAARNLVAVRYGVTKEGILESALKEFDEKHAENEKSAAAKDKLGAAVDSFIAMLKGAVK